ncbi:MAG: NAD(+)/NADH kinase [Candidatus Dadabacteria bacterium]|nr:NAD(+)/NADH kinase [Candidatus Dadabacteria bacterium]MCZ6556114.1 NAD(+)/NADH kinase [Candidatus Dadabacteria bacterium]
MIIGIIAKNNIEEPFEITKKLSNWLKERGVEVYVEKELGKKIRHPNSIDRREIPKLVDVILVFGGDGTFLGVAREACKYGTPILGINLGGLGFLTEVTVDELYPMMERIIDGDYEVEDRQMLITSIRRGKKNIGTYEVLNDVVINKGALARIIDLSIYIEDSHVTTYKADGIILATPTGSTAYSLSAGGPIVHPGIPVTIITPICPHTLTNRPLVVSSEMKVEIIVTTQEPDTYLTLDGQIGVRLKTGDLIEVKRTDTSVKLIKSPFRDFFSILKTKLMWGERYGKIDG